MSSENRDLQQEAIAFSYILHMMEVSCDKSKLDDMSIADAADFGEYLDYVRFGARNALRSRLILVDHTNLSHCSIESVISAVHSTWYMSYDEENEWITTTIGRVLKTRLLAKQFRTTTGGGFVVAYLSDGGVLVLDSKKMVKEQL